eukprot:5194800-Prymnesium_polylepis.2
MSQHAGEYIMMLRGEGRTAFDTFVEQRCQAWNREPRQRIWRCADSRPIPVLHVVWSLNPSISAHSGQPSYLHVMSFLCRSTCSPFATARTMHNGHCLLYTSPSPRDAHES